MTESTTTTDAPTTEPVSRSDPQTKLEDLQTQYGTERKLWGTCWSRIVDIRPVPDPDENRGELVFLPRETCDELASLSVQLEQHDKKLKALAAQIIGVKKALVTVQAETTNGTRATRSAEGSTTIAESDTVKEDVA